MDSSDRDVVGREEEIDALIDFLEAPASSPGVLLLDGEAGIGKTTLWRRGIKVAEARACRVLSCRPSGSEAQLSSWLSGTFSRTRSPTFCLLSRGRRATRLRSRFSHVRASRLGDSAVRLPALTACSMTLASARRGTERVLAR